jgi:superfamily II DNA helicase RecQ
MKIKLIFFITSVLLLSCNSNVQDKEEEMAWKVCIETNTLTAIDSFLTEFPNTKHKAEIAKKRDGILYRTALAENTLFHLKNYQREFPQGKHKKEIEKILSELKTDKISLNNFESLTFVGTLRYSDKKNSGNNILTMKFTLSEDRESNVEYNVTAYLSSNLKKELKAVIEKEKMSIKFVEDTEDEFLLNFAEGKLYLKNNLIFIESVDPAADAYWNLKQINSVKNELQ